MNTKIQMPSGFTARKESKELIISAEGKEVKREMFHPLIDLKIKDNEILLDSKKENRNMKKMMMTHSAHIKNMVRGLQKPFTYKLKVCGSHYPITVKVEGKNIIIINYLGQKVPKKCKIVGDAKVTVNKDEITVESMNKEYAGMTAGIIEKTCQVKNYDRRIFQDGIYIIEKDGKKI
ncbi:MAG: 50S ribosomal protein L6 [Candidatus Nanoarchaeia archaeon]|nr:50S ribosomal protein L6 [Candidatus Nanoarchaeia archaeon]